MISQTQREQIYLIIKVELYSEVIWETNVRYPKIENINSDLTEQKCEIFKKCAQRLIRCKRKM